jgi:hypothetical protein
LFINNNDEKTDDRTTEVEYGDGNASTVAKFETESIENIIARDSPAESKVVLLVQESDKKLYNSDFESAVEYIKEARNVSGINQQLQDYLTYKLYQIALTQGDEEAMQNYKNMLASEVFESLNGPSSSLPGSGQQ